MKTQEGGGGCPTCEDIGRGGEVVPHVKTQEGGGGCPTCEDTGRGGRLSHM